MKLQPRVLYNCVQGATRCNARYLITGQRPASQGLVLAPQLTLLGIEKLVAKALQRPLLVFFFDQEGDVVV